LHHLGRHGHHRRLHREQDDQHHDREHHDNLYDRAPTLTPMIEPEHPVSLVLLRASQFRFIEWALLVTLLMMIPPIVIASAANMAVKITVSTTLPRSSCARDVRSAIRAVTHIIWT
jgi:hypothetical protein